MYVKGSAEPSRALAFPAERPRASKAPSRSPTKINQHQHISAEARPNQTPLRGNSEWSERQAWMSFPKTNHISAGKKKNPRCQYRLLSHKIPNPQIFLRAVFPSRSEK